MRLSIIAIAASSVAVSAIVTHPRFRSEQFKNPATRSIITDRSSEHDDGSHQNSCPYKDEIFSTAPRKNIFLGLTGSEAAEVTKFLHDQPILNLTAVVNATSWDNRIILVELLQPNKSDALPYLNGHGHAPKRYAKAAIQFQATEEPYIQDWMVGPLPISEKTKLQPLNYIHNSGDGKQRVYHTDPQAEAAFYMQIGVSIADITIGLWNGTFMGQPNDTILMDGMEPLWIDDGAVITWSQFLNYPKILDDRVALLPLGLYVKTNIAGRDPSKWSVEGWFYNGKFYETTEKFREAFYSPGFEKLAPNVDGEWTSTDRTGQPFKHDKIAPPVAIQPEGRRFAVDVKEKYVEWMDFSFLISFNRDTGVRLFDIKYQGKRIIYELGLQEALSHYASNDPLQSGVSYLDTLDGFGRGAFELVRGYDCPSYATYLNTTYYGEETTHTHLNSICLFEADTGHAIQRHSSPLSVGVTKNIVFTLRSVSTVGNYDFTFDYTFFLDGSIHVTLRLSGYIQSAYWANNNDYGFKIHDNLSGSMHDHVVNYKLDLDINGTANSLMKTTVVPVSQEYPWSNGQKRNTMKLEKSFIKNEDESKLNWRENSPDMFAVVNKDTPNKYGEYPGYRIVPATHNAAYLTVVDSSNLKQCANWAKHHLYIVKQKDTEPQSTSPYNCLDPAAPVVDFDKFFNGESLEQEDLVVYFNLGMHHIPDTSDLPNTIMTSAVSSMAIVPQNYFLGQPSRATRQQVRVDYGRGTPAKVEKFGSHQAKCEFDMENAISNLTDYKGDIVVRKFPYAPWDPYEVPPRNPSNPPPPHYKKGLGMETIPNSSPTGSRSDVSDATKIASGSMPFLSVTTKTTETFADYKLSTSGSTPQKPKQSKSRNVSTVFPVSPPRNGTLNPNHPTTKAAEPSINNTPLPTNSSTGLKPCVSGPHDVLPWRTASQGVLGDTNDQDFSVPQYPSLSDPIGSEFILDTNFFDPRFLTSLESYDEQDDIEEINPSRDIEMKEWHSPSLSMPQEITFGEGSSEMLLAHFDQRTCGILSVKDGVGENPWRTSVWPLARESPAVYHAVCALAAFHKSKESSKWRYQGVEHMRESIRELAMNIETMRTDAAIATTLALAFAESWDIHISTGIQHLRGAKVLLHRALSQQLLKPPDQAEQARLHFLYNSWMYLAVIAQLTSLGDTEFTGIQLPATCMPRIHEVDPLMGCAATLFPLLGRVANLVQKVRNTKSNSIAIISQAIELKMLLEQWTPPSYFEAPEDPSSDVQHSFQTAQAYRWATLLHLHQAVPEIPSESAADLAKQVLVLLATVPPSSRAIIVQIYPLLTASCEVESVEDRKWVLERWAAMQRRLMIGNIDRCLEVIREVWSRRDNYNLSMLNSHRIPYVVSVNRPGRRNSSIGSETTDEEMLGMEPDSHRVIIEDAELSPLIHAVDPNLMLSPYTSVSRRGSSSLVDNPDFEKTVRGRLHWIGVMSDWQWEDQHTSPRLYAMPPPVALNYYPKAQSTFKPPLIANNNAFLGDVFTSQKENPEKPVSCGFYRLEKGEPLVYTYTYDEMKIILEGQFEISDATGRTVVASPGDVFYFPKGATITFKTQDYGLAFFTGQRGEGEA
ncbi:hypothetical protein FQN57_003124 [Myotisia sp. PD_48]|nr:hypothetical protein FQN57_003124 [Myotisia sp. PD_48]